MSSANPYQTPQSIVQTKSESDDEKSGRFEKMAFGQKLVIYAVMLYFIAIPLGKVINEYALILVLGSLLLSLVGVFKILSARESHILVKICLFALLFIPMINMLMLLSINSRATKALREAGYKVGLLGATKQRSDADVADIAESPLLAQ